MTGKPLQGEVAIVTGAGRGFGKAIACALARAGASVVLTARSKGGIEAGVAEIEAAGGKALAVPGDVTNRDDVARVVAAAGAAFGPVTIMVNNAGVPGPFGPIGTMDPDEWWQSQAIHMRGPFLFMSAVLPEMQKRKAGRIINIVSLGGKSVTPGLSAYGVGKNALWRLTEHVAAENRDSGVKVFAVEPGTAVTGMAEATMGDAAVKEHMPWMIEILEQVSQESDSTATLERCGQFCVEIASGDMDDKSGEFLEAQSDFADLIEAKRSK